MQSHDEYYSMKASLSNLMLLKLAFDRGIDIKKYPDYMVDIQYNDDADWSIFIKIIESIFTIVEFWFPYCGEEEIPNKNYWTNAIDNPISDLESMGVLVIMDDRINHSSVYSGTLSSSGDDWYCGYAEMAPIENGMVVTWDENDGNVDLVDVLYGILESFPNKEDKQIAVAL